MSKQIQSTLRTLSGTLLALVIYTVPSFLAINDERSYPVDTAPALGAAIATDWTVLPNIVKARFESSAVQYRDDIYAFNGFGPGIKIEPTVEKLDASTLSWSVIGETSVAKGNAVTHNGVVLNGNEVWIIGGRIGSHPGPVTSNVWKFNLDTLIWAEGPELPAAGAAGGAALVDGRIHWFGGLDIQAQCDVNNHYVYDLNNPSAGWEDLSGIAPMPVPRNHFATVVLDGLIYAIGGQFTHGGCGSGTPDTELSHVFDPQSNSWDQIASLPAVQSHIEPSTFVYQGAIYVIGGATNGTKVFRYDPASNQWDTVAVLPQPLLAPVARVVNNELIVSTGGAPSIQPTWTTYKTDMTPLLLPDAQNNIKPDDMAADQTDMADTDSTDASDTADTGVSHTLPAEEGAHCDYSNANVNNGWGWDPLANVSCPPATDGQDSSAIQPQTAGQRPIEDSKQAFNSGNGSADLRLLVLLWGLFAMRCYANFATHRNLL